MILRDLLNKLTEKQKRILLIGGGLLVLVLVIVLTRGGEIDPTTSPFGTNEEIPEGLARVTVNTTPAGALAFIGEYNLTGVTPSSINEIPPGEYTIRAEKIGYYIAEQTVTVAEGENEFTVHMERVPALEATYRNRLMVEPRLINGGGPKPYAIHMNPRRRTLEAYDGQTAVVFDYSKLRDLNEIHWFNSTKAVVVTGNTKDEKVDYIVDFSNVYDVTTQQPEIRQMPLPGFMYTWSLDGDSLSFFSDTNYDTGESSLFRQIIANQATPRDRLGTNRFTGAVELEWLADDTYFYVRETEGTEAVGDGDRFDLIFIAPTGENGNWEETIVEQNLGSRPVVSRDKSKIVYSARGVLYVFDVLSGEKLDLGSLAEYGANLGYSFFGNTAIVMTTYEQNVGMTFYILDFLGNAVHSYVSEVGVPEGYIQQVHRDIQGKIIVNFTSGDTYVFTDSF